MPYRWLYIGLGLVAIAAIAFGLIFYAEGEEQTLPGVLESVSPAQGDLVPLQAIVEIDLEAGYEAVIYVDGWQVADATYVEPTAVYRWTPSPSNPTFNEWTPGEHTIRVEWDTSVGMPDPGSYEWSFRVG